MSKPLHEMDAHELEQMHYRGLSEEARRANIYYRTEESKHLIDKANEDIQHLIYLNKRQIAPFANFHRQFISLSAFLVACIIGLLINTSGSFSFF